MMKEPIRDTLEMMPLNGEEQSDLRFSKDISSLHKVWNRKIGDKFTPNENSKPRFKLQNRTVLKSDTTDAPSTEDEIDAKGVISAIELEEELKSMHRYVGYSSFNFKIVSFI